MLVLLYQQKVDDKKHNIQFNKDKISYRGKTFDAVLSHDFRKVMEKSMKDNDLKFPLSLDLSEADYFTKFVKYTRNDGTDGMKAKIVITGASKIEQGQFDSKSLDDICDDMEQAKAKALSETEED